ncbi:two-component system phosphate regulon sensor histidine kinase PhoR [Staphylococcus hominis]|mgnify:FL=1|uniref:two-component system histidine kinase PnpS n=1 Tax=Staphylococcus TaxID=1279 RepID=UPI0008A5F4C4|nr:MULTISPECIES: ATP-binding protein [Staphylococcus]MBB4831790.1 two-component system phosphate regulon sensor histidine kinase PhoR [Staphylococcus hominis]MCI2889850.1 ATP-binding protein [Staphylococcus hominis]MDS3866630.1 ATP-binding protein [Staphylococcus hominis]OFO39765.1 histidine kinase [Staphylococcus sp. HMSC070D05]TRM00427.1 sensor histidine kinase [Staphylococcus hominis]
MIKFHHRLLLLLCTITIISFIGLGAILHHTIYQILSDTQTRELNHLSENIVNLNNRNKQADIQRIAQNQNLVVEISENGQVLYQTGNQHQINHNIDNAANPSNIIYHKNKDKVDYTFKNTVNNQTIYISGINTETLDLQKNMWKYLSLIGIIVLIAIYLAVRSINRTYIRPINEVTYATSLIADGYYHVRVPESNVKETKALFVTTNDLARRLQKLNNKQKMQSNRLKTTLENIPSSVLMIDKQGEIVIANHAYYEVFKPDSKVENKDYTVHLDKEIQHLIIESFKTEKPLYEQIELYINDVHQKYFDVSCIPILSKSKKKLQGMVVVLHDITNLKKLENLRREFVANVSHELKTPITSIKGFAETLIEGAKNDEQSLDMFLNIILKESNRIESLVMDLLDLSHIEQQTEIETAYVNLSDLAHNTIHNLQTQAKYKNIAIKSEIENDVIIETHEGKLSQVITNLLSNAINYSYENNKVIVRVYREDIKVNLEIQDYGIGIDKKDQKHIFERFYRVDKARSRDSGGTGLGLSITKHIVEALHGTIMVESELNKGSLFRVSFIDKIE